jgi:serine/threonine-protein kinase
MPGRSQRTVELGSFVAGYQVVRLLGTGGSGAVYLTQPETALKIANPDIIADPRFRTQFRRAAELARTLQHPNVLPVHNHGEIDGEIFWVAMAYIAGTDADAALRFGRMHPMRAVRIIAEIALALDYVHRRGLVHGDVKPSNFLLAEHDSGSEQVLLADFGLARAVGDRQHSAATSRPTVLITVAYAAPEALLGYPADHRSDIYSLGCSLFRLLTGKPPFFDAGSKPATVHAQLHSEPPRATDFAPWLPDSINTVISTAMDKDPCARYRTAGELALAVRSAMCR